MLSDKKYGLSVNVMATRVMPSLLPQTVNPSLNLEQFTLLLGVRTNNPKTNHLKIITFNIFNNRFYKKCLIILIDSKEIN